MKNWKKLSTLVLAMVLCLSISACGGDSGDGGETADAPAVLEDYAYDSAADASGYDTYIGNWVGTGDAENDTLEVTTTDGGMYFTIYYINDIKASGAAQNVPEYVMFPCSACGIRTEMKTRKAALNLTTAVIGPCTKCRTASMPK